MKQFSLALLLSLICNIEAMEKKKHESGFVESEVELTVQAGTKLFHNNTGEKIGVSFRPVFHFNGFEPGQRRRLCYVDGTHKIYIQKEDATSVIIKGAALHALLENEKHDGVQINDNGVIGLSKSEVDAIVAE